jgi:hypothetical protein
MNFNTFNRMAPLGGGVCRLFKVGKLLLNIQLSVYDNVITPKERSGAGLTARERL